MRRLRLLAIPLFLVALLLLPSSPRVFSQGCVTVPLSASELWVASVDGGIIDATGYTFEQMTGETGFIYIQFWDGSVWLSAVELPYTPDVITSLYTDARISVDIEAIDIRYCAPASPTPTFTPTPTEVIVTVTPSPTPTIVPWIVLQERTDQTFSLQIFGFTIMLGVAIYFFRRL